MRTQSKELIKLVEQLALVIEARKQADKRESELKEEIRVAMGNDLVLEAGNYCVLVEIKNRSSLCKEAIAHDLGHAFVEKYSQRSQYECMFVKPVKLNVVAL